VRRRLSSPGTSKTAVFVSVNLPVDAPEPIDDLRHLALPLDRVAPSKDQHVQHVAETLDPILRSPGLEYGYGPGESILEAHRRKPDVIRGLLDDLMRFSPNEIAPAMGDPMVRDALEARKNLFREVRATLAAHPKSPSGEATT
jgi:hypothetical protein